MEALFSGVTIVFLFFCLFGFFVHFLFYPFFFILSLRLKASSFNNV